MIGGERGVITQGLERAHRSESALEHEGARWRVLLIWIAMLIGLGTAPIVGHHIVSGGGSLTLSGDHLFGLCLVALQSMLSPVHETFHLVLFAGLIFAMKDRMDAGRELKHVLQTLPGERPRRGTVFERAATRAGQTTESVYVVDGLPNPAFTAGWLRPRIYLAAQLERLLTEDELTAVIRHEGAHAHRRDPLRFSVMRFFASTLFYIPALRCVADDLADEAEIEADTVAAADDPEVLASAILALADFASRTSDGLQAFSVKSVPTFQTCGLLERRVRRLVGEPAPPRSHVTLRSLVMAFATLAIVWLSGLSAAVASASTNSRSGHVHVAAPHCQHHHGMLLTHLFCPGASLAEKIGRCPHGTG